MESFYDVRMSLSERLPIVIYTNLFLPHPATVWMSPQVEQLTGYRVEEWVNCPEFFLSVVHPDDRDNVMNDVFTSRRDLRPFSRDYRLLRRNGEVMWIHDESVPIFGPDGSPQLMQGYFVDVTDRKELEQQLLHAQKIDALGRLATEIAHDFNNHLMAIQGNVAMLERRIADDTEAQARVHDVTATVQRAAQLTRRLLDYGRYAPSRPRSVSLDDVVVGLTEMLERVAGEKVELLVQLRATQSVFADPAHLEQVIVNLVANARDAMPGGGVVSVLTSDVPVRSGLAADRLGVRVGDYVALTVADNGPGIDPPMQRRIFEPFFTTKQEGHGTGLGLSIVDKVVRQAGGAIDLQSAPGMGSRFRILLPVAASS